MAEETVRTEAQETSVQELTDRINGQLLEIAELHRKNTDIYKEIGVLEQALSEKEALLLTVQDEKERLEEECRKNDAANWMEKAERLAAERDRLRCELEAAAVREKALAEHISGMENSRSWKVTKPLRAVKSMLKKG